MQPEPHALPVRVCVLGPVTVTANGTGDNLAQYVPTFYSVPAPPQQDAAHALEAGT